MAETIINSNQVSNPNTYWFNNRTGASLSTGLNISNASNVSVYKNGILLQPGQLITGRHYTGGGNHSVALLNTAPLSTANSWSVSMRLNWTPTAGTSPAIMNGAGNSDYQVPTITNDSGTGKILFLISSTGSSWDLVNGSSTTLSAPASGTVFDLKLNFTGSKYEMTYSDDYGRTWTVGQTNTTSTKTYCNSPFRFLYNKLSAGIDFNNSSTIYWEKTKIIIDDVTWFDGATAVENTDYENDGCTVTNVTTATNDYAVDTFTGTIYFADNIINDNIIVQVGGVGSAGSSFDPTSITGYDATKSQALLNSAGTLVWADYGDAIKCTTSQGFAQFQPSATPLATADNWKIETRFTYTTTNPSGAYNWFLFSGSSSSSAPLVYFTPGYLSAIVPLQNGGQAGSHQQFQPFSSAQDGDLYDLELVFSGTEYYFNLKKSTESTFTKYSIASNSNKAKFTDRIRILNVNNELTQPNYYPMFLSKTKITYNNGTVLFDGKSSMYGIQYITSNTEFVF